MSPLSKLLLLSCLVCAAACTVPSIEDVEQEEGAAGCNDSDHTCPANFVCYENRCIQLTSDMACRPGTSEDCTSSGLGECVAGARVCGAEGTFGACESKKKPALEQCDGLDNDCDGKLDNLASFNVTKNQDADASLVAVPIGGPGTGAPELTLIVTTESGKVVTRTLSPDGALHDGVTFSPTSGGRYTAVTAVSAGGAALAWLEQPGPLDGTKIKLYVALLNERGEVLRDPVEMPYTNGGASPNASEVKLAANLDYILMLVRTTGAAAPVPEIWALTVPDELVGQPVSTAFRLATPVNEFGLHATESGTSSQFLVAYESAQGRYVAAISNQGALVGAPVLLFRDQDTHSPYLVPKGGSDTDFSLFYVRYDPNQNKSYLSLDVFEGGEHFTPTPYPRAGFIERMRMTAPAGAPRPSLALWALRDNRGSSQRSIEAARLSFTSGLVDVVAPLSLSNSPTFSEVPIQPPGDSYYVAYQHNPAAPTGSAVSLPLEVDLRPFCKL